MRFLHTADWHVGKTLRGRSRMDEFAAALDEVVGDRARGGASTRCSWPATSSTRPAPPAEAEKLVYDFLARLRARADRRASLIAGNHDHPRKLAALAELLEGLRIFVRAEPSPAGPRAASCRFRAATGPRRRASPCCPFVAERKVVDACALLAAEHTGTRPTPRRLEQMLGTG